MRSVVRGAWLGLPGLISTHAPERVLEQPGGSRRLHLERLLVEPATRRRCGPRASCYVLVLRGSLELFA